MKRILPLMLALLLLLSAACAETIEDYVLVTVNGEDLFYNEYRGIESAYLAQYEAAGVDLSDPATYTYLQDLAMTYAVEQMLVRQDMQAQGCYDFDAETEAWFVETGKAAYQTAMADVIASMRTYDPTMSEEDLMIYAQAYATALGVNEQTYIDFYRTQYASVKYYDWLIRDNPVTDEDVQAAYAARVEASKALYENNVVAFETALNSGAEVWYMPAGYRNILQILLPAQGSTEAEKLASVQSTVNDICARLEKGESFESLIAEYGTDANFANESFLATGYQVHKDSIVWEDAFIAAAFSAEMTQPGCWSQPIVSDLGVHILYYLGDAVSGPIELTEDLESALSYVIYTERHTAAQAERITVLANTAELVFY